MKIHILCSRKLRKSMYCIKKIISAVSAFPFVKPALAVFVSLCLLLVLAPYILSRLAPSDEPEKELIPQASFELVKTPSTIDIFRTEKNKTETLSVEDYIKGVVSCEMPSSFHEEALKAQAVAARTYAVSRVCRAYESGNPDSHPQAPLCDSTHCQVYRSESENRTLKGDSWMKDSWKKICAAVDDTEGQLLYYNGELVTQALFHSSSGGKTENCEDVFAAAVPYLVSVDSPYEDEATHQNETTSFSINEFVDKIKSEYPDIEFGEINASGIKILSRSSGGRVEKIQIGNGVISGRNVREALSLPSANFEIDVSDDSITFTSNGSGHGVGMSQYGADGMAKKGYNYREILSHYYSGTQVY